MWKRAKRTFLWLLFALFGLIVVLLLSIPLAAIGSEQRLAAVTNVLIPGANDAPPVRAYVARPAGEGPFPAVILIHEFFGLNKSITGKADGLAEAGYLVVAPDTFRGSTTSWIPRAIYQVITTSQAQVNADLDSVFAWLEAQPDVDVNRVGIVGFCYGGRVSLLYSLHNQRMAATVIFYGSSETDPAVLQNLPGPVLGIFGGADASIPLEEVRALEDGLRQAGVPYEITVYEGQPHAFVTDMQAIRAGGAPGQAWQQMLRFLETHLKNAGARSNGLPVAHDPGFAWRYYTLLVWEHAFGSAVRHTGH
ncbi:MAG: dienelactone hydrolase family protein [Anaerolineales bacterium]|nr:dienelactone hydrolase family protein [Anaerolineales bacterium]MDW8277534.1 dienelactone hydrolase family protein [Anaerolineales bacterium]